LIEKLPLGIAAALLLALVAFSVTPAEQASAQDPDIVVTAGDGETGYAVNAFLPGTVTIMEGESISWAFPWFEPHIVAFGTPPDGAAPSAPGTEWPNDSPGYVVSDIIFGNPGNPPTFGPIVFPEAGSYAYFCPIHPQMTATVNVVASGDVDTQAEVDARGAAELAPRLAAVKALGATLAAQSVTVTPRPNGTSLYDVVVGGATAVGDDVMQFFPPAANVKVGDTIRWSADDNAPHTVTFNAPPGPPQGDPFEIPRTPNTSFDGNGFTHSGILWTVPDPAFFTTYELTFTATGSFQYVCILHAPQGMMGTVNVAAAPTPTPTAPAPPSTGSGTTPGGGTGTSPLWFLSIAGLLAAVAAVGAVATIRR
jgi:plastocyanin